MLIVKSTSSIKRMVSFSASVSSNIQLVSFLINLDKTSRGNIRDFSCPFRRRMQSTFSTTLSHLMALPQFWHVTIRLPGINAILCWQFKQEWKCSMLTEVIYGQHIDWFNLLCILFDSESYCKTIPLDISGTGWALSMASEVVRFVIDSFNTK